MKIKESNKTQFVNINYLKEIIGRIILRKGGFPRFMVKYIIDDLIELKLLERIAFNNYKIIESSCDKRVKQLVSSYC